MKFCALLRYQPMSWGASDCVLAAAGAVEVQTGADFAARHRGKYHDEVSARAYMDAQGWADVDAVADAFLPRINPKLHRRGDILLFRGDLGLTLGICLGVDSMVMGPEGGILIRSRHAIAAWRVG